MVCPLMAMLYTTTLVQTELYQQLGRIVQIFMVIRQLFLLRLHKFDIFDLLR